MPGASATKCKAHLQVKCADNNGTSSSSAAVYASSDQQRRAAASQMRRDNRAGNPDAAALARVANTEARRSQRSQDPSSFRPKTIVVTDPSSLCVAALRTKRLSNLDNRCPRLYQYFRPSIFCSLKIILLWFICLTHSGTSWTVLDLNQCNCLKTRSILHGN